MSGRGTLKKLKSRHRRRHSRSQLIAMRRKSRSKQLKQCHCDCKSANSCESICCIPTPDYKPVPEKVYKSDKLVSEFRTWCKEEGLELHPNLYIGEQGSCHKIGVVATEAIAIGECLAVIPRDSILTCRNSCIGGIVEIEKDESLAKMTSSWIPLLLALAAEYSADESHWNSYLNLVPNNEDCPPPMMWSPLERKRLLEATCVDKLVDNDLQRIKDDFDNIVLPFMKKHHQYFIPKMWSLPEYHKLVSFVMSYSFTDGEDDSITSSTMMVPFVDLLNHSSHHNAELTFHDQALRLLAVRDISKGEEVMNTFGDLPNTSLLHTYGFTEQSNPNDIVLITSEHIKHVYLKSDDSADKLKTRWHLIESTDMLEEDYCVDKDGDPYPELILLIKLLYTRKFDAFVKKVKNGSVREFTLGDLSEAESSFLKRLIDYRLSLFPERYESLVPLLEQPGDVRMSDKERYSLQLTIGQQQCLRAFQAEMNKTTEQEIKETHAIIRL